MRQGIYELRTVQMPDLDGGQLVAATEEDRTTLTPMMTAFVRFTEPNLKSPEDKAQGMTDRLIQARGLYLWRNRSGETVSMAARVRESTHGTSISLVYTPPECRGNGYASRIVATLSQLLLDEGKELCNLYTDLSNPTSNTIYQRISYTQLAESWLHRFAP